MSSLPFGVDSFVRKCAENTGLGAFREALGDASPPPRPSGAGRTLMASVMSAQAQKPSPVAGAVVEAPARGQSWSGQGWARARPQVPLHPPRDSSGPPGWPGKRTSGQVTARVPGSGAVAITASEQLPPGPQAQPRALTYVDGPAAVHRQPPLPLKTSTG